MSRSHDLQDTYGDIDGGFTDLASFRAELGPDVAHISDDEARRIIDENLREKGKLTREQRAQLDDAKDADDYDDTVYKDMAQNMRAKAETAEAERRRLAAELAREKARLSSERNDLLSSQSRLRSDLELEKLKRLYGDSYTWRSPGSLEDYLTKERLKREVKEELLDEKRRAKQQKDLAKLWTADTKPARAKSPKSKAKSPASKPKSKAKSPKSKSKSKSKAKK